MTEEQLLEARWEEFHAGLRQIEATAGHDLVIDHDGKGWIKWRLSDSEQWRAPDWTADDFAEALAQHLIETAARIMGSGRRSVSYQDGKRRVTAELNITG